MTVQSPTEDLRQSPTEDQCQSTTEDLRLRLRRNGMTEEEDSAWFSSDVDGRTKAAVEGILWQMPGISGSSAIRQLRVMLDPKFDEYGIRYEVCRNWCNENDVKWNLPFLLLFDVIRSICLRAQVDESCVFSNETILDTLLYLIEESDAKSTHRHIVPGVVIPVRGLVYLFENRE